MSVTSKALWYIESHLDADVGLEAVAESAGVSRFHLSRAFAQATGMSLAGYGRARRLSEAARALTSGAPVIVAVALGAGYGSHEAFTRAFRQHFGVTPEQFRAEGAAALVKFAGRFQEPIRLSSSGPSELEPPRVVESGEKLIFGLGQPCPAAGDPGIPGLWNRFVPHIGHIPGQVGNVACGVICHPDESGSYEYVSGVEVSSFPKSRAEFVRLRIPAQTYAVFWHRGHVSAVAGTWRAIWETGLDETGLRAAEGPAFEVYGAEFDGRTGMGGFGIWVPVVGG